jgi:alanine racemase
MWQAEVQVDLGAIRANAALLASGTTAQVMAVVKADGYGHGAVEVARAAWKAGRAGWRVHPPGSAAAARGGLEAPTLAWLWMPDQQVDEAVGTGDRPRCVEPHALSAAEAAARRSGRVARVHLKLDTGLSRGGATVADWPALAEAAAASQADGLIDVVGAGATSSTPMPLGTRRSTASSRASTRAWRRPSVSGSSPLRHIAIRRPP